MRFNNNGVKGGFVIKGKEFLFFSFNSIDCRSPAAERNIYFFIRFTSST